MTVMQSERDAVRQASAATAMEEVIDPGQWIVDAHHHLYVRPGIRYLRDEFLEDLDCGHDIRATVFVQAQAMYRETGPEQLRPVGETEYASEVATSCERRGAPRLCAGIVGYVDLTLGDGAREVLDAHLLAAGGPTRQGVRFAGIRHITAWHPDSSLLNPRYPASEDLMDDANFRSAFGHLGQLGLTFDAWVYFPQLARLEALARAFPETTIVVDHCGGVLGTGPYAGKHDAVFAAWSTGMRRLASCPNVMVKLGGMGMPLCGFGFDETPSKASSIRLADAWRPWMETCIDAFGTGRCMVESNFPPDRVSYSYAMYWNAMKRIAKGSSQDEKDNLFWRTATRCYGLPVPHPS
jgi:L-fuconolactonase